MILLFLFAFTGVPLARVWAFEFDPNNIISNENATNTNDLSRTEIQNFLKGKNSSLTYYEALTKDGQFRLASDIINRAATEFGISKRFLLVMLQREQSLVTIENPNEIRLDWAMGYGVCDACTLEDASIQRFKGFEQQVRSAAAQFRYYFDNPQGYDVQVGQATTIDGTSINAVNQATANLYIYTPHIIGNRNFATIWNSWFGPPSDSTEDTSVPEVKRPHPDGSLLQAEGDENVWYIKDGKKKLIASPSVLASRFDREKILRVSQDILDLYEEGTPVKFHQYALVSDESGSLFLIINDKKRKFESADVFRSIGYHPEEVIPATSAELDYYTSDLPITQYTSYPTGILMQDTETGGIFYVESGKKYAILDPSILELDFAEREIQTATPTQLTKYLRAEDYKLRDGILMKSATDTAVYVISNGKKHPIISGDVFEKLGFAWGNIVHVSEKILEIHPTGDPITGEFN